MPDWGELIIRIGSMYNLSKKQMESIQELIKNKDYLDAIDEIKAQGIDELNIQTAVSDYILQYKKTTDKDVDHNYVDLIEMHCTKYITTNYDNFLADYFESQVFTLEDIGQGFLNEIAHNKYDNTIINLHGMIGKPNTIVFSKQSYEKLYQSELYKETFEAFKNRYTFLFIGFSLDDIYFQELMDKSKRLTRSRHFILLSESEATEEKIHKLRNRYDVECIIYSITETSHQEAIRRILESICLLEQAPQKLDTGSVENKIIDISATEGKLDKLLRQIKQNESKYQIGTALKKYLRLLTDEDFQILTDNQKRDVYLGMVFCYGYLCDYPSMKRYLELARLINTEEDYYFIYRREAEYYYNLHEWDKAIEAIEAAIKFKSNDPTLLVFRDLLKACSSVEEPRSVAKPQELQEYRVTLHKYVDNDFKLYAQKVSKEEQKYTYLMLGNLAGQVYQQYLDAIKLLNKAYNLGNDLHILEELGLYYYYAAIKEAHLESLIRLIDVDLSMLRRARDCFELVIAKSNGKFKESVYKRIGYQYLKLLEISKEYYRLSKEYDAVYPYFGEEYDMILMKANCDLEMGKMDNNVLLRLNPEDRLLISMGYYHRQKKFDIIIDELRSIIDREEISTKRLYQFFLDALFFRGRSKLFDEYYKKYQENWRKDDTDQLYDIYAQELSGNLADAEKGYIELCEKLESPLIYQQLLQFYTRCNRPEMVEEIYDTLATKKRDITAPDASNFYCVYIVFLINQRNYEKAVDFYCAYEALIIDENVKMELENLIKPLICDYSNYEQRINEYKKIYEEFSVPHALYEIGILYLNNNQFEKAKEYLDKAEIVGFSIDQHIRNASEILLGKQVDSPLLMPSKVCEIIAIKQLKFRTPLDPCFSCFPVA
ncbi:SIR2 family NAD-dependent protein deacylase [Desulfosporosinus metallidurans]|nr:SIR2 family protein [Desulfosporosinus metallidurans]